MNFFTQLFGSSFVLREDGGEVDFREENISVCDKGTDMLRVNLRRERFFPQRDIFWEKGMNPCLDARQHDIHIW